MGVSIQNIFQPFEIQLIETHHCPMKIHKNTFFQLAYIVDGEGWYHINENKFKYKPLDLFLLKPMDVQYTEVGTKTSFLFIRFNNIYFDGQKVKDEQNNLGGWIKKLEYIYHNSNPEQGSIIRNENDKPVIQALTSAIIHEHINEQPFQRELLQQFINSLITLVARNISSHVLNGTGHNEDPSLAIIHYIQANIYQPDKLKAEKLAAHFNISLNYVSEYFKKHTSQTLQQYILNYRMSLVEIRLRHSDLRLNQIADEFGFTDESHLAKTFKKYKGLTPTHFRRSVLKEDS
jgi:AraC-like DNA-binding protein